MKKILLSTVALLGLTMTAGAADLPRRTVAPMVSPIVAVPVFTWTGFYVGVNAGYGFGDNKNDQSTYFIPTSTGIPVAGNLTISNFGNDNREGFVGGAQVGYNFQFGMFVAGIEADLQYADFGGRNAERLGTFTYTGVGSGLTSVVTNDISSLEYFGTVRARLGVAFDRVLVYGTGGFAFGGTDRGNNFCGAFRSCSNDDTSVGYAVGGGVEYAFTNNLTFKLEGLYVNLGDNGNNAAAAFDRTTGTLYLEDRKRDMDFGVVRVGVNYKF
ncbi:outer membrane protein [Salinarimonas soli]|uniref:Porin family protein n=1 Tax=Salinarimonas soli TaxID=1638099 RepID=A0A5B2V953_9HYPH|nr:outer membrane beta-barrel protein [Salinarimonas soli]KAA2235356.1 porin family protein [Salinarimonas soli]